MSYIIEMTVHSWSEVADILKKPTPLRRIMLRSQETVQNLRHGAAADIRTVEGMVATALHFEAMTDDPTYKAIKQLFSVEAMLLSFNLKTYQLALPDFSKSQIAALEETTNPQTHERNGIHAVRILQDGRPVSHCVQGRQRLKI